MLNYWLWLFLLVAPDIVFSVKPEAPLWKRSLRLIIAVILCYVLMNLAWMLHSDRVRDAYEACIDIKFPHSASYHKECGDNGLRKYLSLMGALFLAPLYVGYCEMAWLYRYRKRATDIGFISFTILLVCVLVTGLLVYGIGLAISMRV